MRDKLIFGIITVFSLILLSFGFIYLPENVVVKINSLGQPTNTLPKMIAITIPFTISFIGGIFYMKNYGVNKIKYLIISIIGLLVQILNLIFNKIIHL